MKAIPIIFDTDPGIDDAAAICIAVRNPGIDVKLISAVGANVEIEKTTANSLKLMEFLDADIPVARGCGEPLIRKLEPSTYVHGVSGMDGYDFPEPVRKPVEKHAVEAMRDMIMNSEEKITLVVIGTHTNIAVLFKMYPEVKEHIKEIVTMGGGLAGGNTNSAVEFNIYNDPHAAHIVFNSGVPVTMFGLNATHQASITMKNADAIGAGGRTGHMIRCLLEQYKVAYPDGNICIHDTTTIAYLLRPDLFKTRMLPIEIVMEGPASGATVCDFRAMLAGKKEPNINVVTEVDVEGYRQWIVNEFQGD